MSLFWNLTISESNFYSSSNPDFQTQPGSDIAYHTIIFILAILALCIVCRLPRAIARLSRASEWPHGHFLRHTRRRRPKPAMRSAAKVYPSGSKELASDDSHTLYSHTHMAPRLGGKGVRMSYPPHVATCLPFLRPVITVFRTRISPGFSLAQVFFLSVYCSILVYAAFYKSSPFTDPVRAGFIAMGQIPIVFALGAKNNIMSVMMGLGYEKLNFLHRFVGRLLVLAANVHSIGYFYKWSAEGTFMLSMKTPTTAWGFVALLSLDVIFVSSLAFWRQKAYRVFLNTHIVGFSVLLPAAWFHKPTMIPYVLAALGIYGLDRVLRLLKTRVCRATLRPLPELGVTRIEVPYLNSGWRAGQHVRIRVISSGMGWWGWTEVHPFTIASASGGQEGLVLMCKKAGRWTNNLYELAKVGGYSERGLQRDVQVTVEGPYGGPGHAIFASYSAAVFVVGGSGVTFALSAIQDLIQKDREGASRVKVMELIWTVQDPTSLTPLLPLLMTMIQQSDLAPLKISVYYTRAPNIAHKDTFHPALTLSPGRPRLGRVLEDVITRAVTLGPGVKDSEPITGLLVATCGPVGLSDDVAKAAGEVEPLRRDQVGGIELHEEVFGW